MSGVQFRNPQSAIRIFPSCPLDPSDSASRCSISNDSDSSLPDRCFKIRGSRSSLLLRVVALPMRAIFGGYGKQLFMRRRRKREREVGRVAPQSLDRSGARPMRVMHRRGMAKPDSAQLVAPKAYRMRKLRCGPFCGLPPSRSPEGCDENWPAVRQLPITYRFRYAPS
jgi:hypothetical protein